MQRGADGRDLSGPALQKRTSFSLFPLTNGWSLQGMNGQSAMTAVPTGDSSSSQTRLAHTLRSGLPRHRTDSPLRRSAPTVPMVGCCLFVQHRKKRKQRKRDADSLSLCSLDINLCSAASIKPNANNLTVTEKGITNNSV
ncbi:rho guanine nucleotide exchange factor 3 isoform X2 [Arapaima gigas]